MYSYFLIDCRNIKSVNYLKYWEIYYSSYTFMESFLECNFWLIIYEIIDSFFVIKLLSLN